MKLRHIRIAAAISVAAPGVAAAHPVADWTETAAHYDAAAPRAPGPPDTRVRALVALAMFEAVNAVHGSYASYLAVPQADGPASDEAAAARAAHDVLLARFPDRAEDLRLALEIARGRAADAASLEGGERVGAAAAAAVLARAAFAPGEDPPYAPAGSAGAYVPTEAPALPPRARLAKPYFLKDPAEVLPPPPPALESQRYARDMEEVRRLGGKASVERTARQTALAVFWARQDILAPLRALTTARGGEQLAANALTYARVMMAADDASNAVSTAKLAYGFWRPITAIRAGTADRNPATVADPVWEPLLRTPLHPEYPCGHCIMTATFATIVAGEFGAGTQIHVQDALTPGASRTVTPAEMKAEASASRIWAGAHFRFAAEAGEAMGEKIGARALRALPAERTQKQDSAVGQHSVPPPIRRIWTVGAPDATVRHEP